MYEYAVTGALLALWLVLSLVGFVRLLTNWRWFGDRAWPMLFVVFLFPGVGWIWPFLATPDTPSDYRLTPPGYRRTYRPIYRRKRKSK